MDNNILNLYNLAKEQVLLNGYGDEIIWQGNLSFENFTESTFLRETAWVILCSGFKEAYVRRIFNMFSLCFCDWESAKVITLKSDICKYTASQIFGNTRKIDAIINIANQINNISFEKFKQNILKNPIEELQKLPYIGPITSYHLAKNLGYCVAKADRHLTRLANENGYNNVQNFCREIAQLSGEKIPVVDIILWRFAELVASKKINFSFE